MIELFLLNASYKIEIISYKIHHHQYQIKDEAAAGLLSPVLYRPTKDSKNKKNCTALYYKFHGHCFFNILKQFLECHQRATHPKAETLVLACSDCSSLPCRASLSRSHVYTGRKYSYKHRSTWTGPLEGCRSDSKIQTLTSSGQKTQIKFWLAPFFHYNCLAFSIVLFCFT